MPKLEFFIVCESVSIDVESGKISLFNVIEDIFTDALPDYVNINAVGLWNVEPEDAGKDYQASLRITPPGLAEGPVFPMNLTRGRLRYRAVFAVRNIPLNQPGRLVVEAMMNGEHVASHTVIVHPAGALVSDEEGPYRPYP